MDLIYEFIREHNQEIGWAMVGIVLLGLILIAIGVVFDEADWMTKKLFLALCFGGIALIASTIIMGVLLILAWN